MEKSPNKRMILRNQVKSHETHRKMYVLNNAHDDQEESN